ncbi:glutaminyl-tRNA synthase (glutamine-hydrolyzing) subunit B [Candidatus Nomurabacteria bacterium RIFCSPHIGHO2_02_FULL_37_13]|uniref:Aspartyl/glutamyl-tRNA(Asn/Gln) amidotransferase subunit B n=1 Tax=Candidatus Nomurabacteria bacterium RIFCSPHIGHO2_02_FULL_37_13 TaxID=1801750 RepID=A0A1F6W6P4_9BACT|nr:MAG: glutaminyl-tRNA synthase (glutamine-hydrolyzing) subunit B [Candidatus Nomurabacteria bacterium RIFCSPHIGHO2_01_FULL_36_23]OGI77482.1 MAG: glutaminyl-tRNA synthase (glutamine-hydrolyzing) subunit B [Candidatus Nomurabacteria bacterium RIFCSPHIGHO2_02_FULL_37_13]OGI87192.1 MAG: glutaminyl-tRNA synthase (glutamine-hydrolyzing) subunit B [Candidatus Nomurabacteria bacterium RIFCSPLOWO2_01_FULL_37_25]
MEKKYYSTIGLEIHAELKTNTKMFCACENNPDERKPNVNICPVCMAHPGALPVLNKKAIENVIKVGLALDGEIADFSEFDRKNYFYPDIPKGYQISQYRCPIVSGGHLADFDITRVHLEEDTATNKHDRGDYSLIDFNRAGVPLMELVTEPHTFQNSDDAAKITVKFAKELQLILWYLGVSEANMEKGEMRVEANISISTDFKKLGTKVEVKNLNSFRSVERAIKYEIDRMIELQEKRKGDQIVQETRGWDENKQKTFSQRKKESSEDYRYFPEPDLPKLKLHEAFDLEKIKQELPELPEAKRARYKKDFEIKEEDIEIYVNDPDLGVRFSAIAKILTNKEKIKIASNYIVSDFLGLKKNNPTIQLPSAKNFAELVNLFSENSISSRVAKDILAMIVVKDESPEKIATEQNLLQNYDEDAFKIFAQKIIDANPKVVADYKGGKVTALMSLVGQIMKETKGSANPTLAKDILINMLK